MAKALDESGIELCVTGSPGTNLLAGLDGVVLGFTWGMSRTPLICAPLFAFRHSDYLSIYRLRERFDATEHQVDTYCKRYIAIHLLNPTSLST